VKSPSHGRNPPRWRQLALKSALALLAASVAVYVIALSAARFLHERSQHAWDERVGTSEQIASRYPAEAASPSAIAVERLAMGLGLDLTPESRNERPPPAEGHAGRSRSIPDSVFQFVHEELADSSASVNEPPEDVLGALAGMQPGLAAIRDHLMHAPPPRWETNLDELLEPVVPDLEGIIQLHRLLAADALIHARAGAHDAAEANLVASWRLNESLRESPVFLSQIIAVAIARLQIGLLRRIDVADVEAWRERLHDHDYRESVKTALWLEGWAFSRLGESDILGERPSWPALGRASLTLPLELYCIADFNARELDGLDWLASQPADCPGDGTGRSAVRERSGLCGSGGRGFDYGARLLEDITRLELGIELTDRWIALSRSRAGAGEELETSRATSSSAVCPGDIWTYEEWAGRGAVIYLNREIDWPHLSGLVLPTRHASEGAQELRHEQRRASAPSG